MTPKRIMVIAGETSGDVLAAELVRELRPLLERARTYSQDTQPLVADLAPRFFGAGGRRLAEAGVELAFDLTSHAVTGLSEVLKNYWKFKRLFAELLRLAESREPHVIVCVDFSGFNRRFARAVKQRVRRSQGAFHNWNPKIVQYVSPQVWASREGRARQIARDYDLLLSIFPFEREWYAKRVPGFPVEFVGHPMLDRHATPNLQSQIADSRPASLVLLPGSRRGELERHLPVMLEAWRYIRDSAPKAAATLVVPDESLASMVREAAGADGGSLQIQVGGLAAALAGATVAIASTGTVTMECAYFGVPTVALYKTSWSTYQIGRRLVTVKYLAMPNLLAGEEVFPEFIQDAATPRNISRAAMELLRDEWRRERVRRKLKDIIASLGGPGASRRAAGAVAQLANK